MIAFIRVWLKGSVYLGIDKCKFTMPFEYVTVEARWSLSIINPDTGIDFSIVLIIVVLTISLIAYFVMRKRKYII